VENVANQAMTARPTFRFAPSPTGELHLGNIYSALLNFDTARRHGGRFLLRIEDIDVTRSRPEFVADIFDMLGWLGLDSEQPVRRQSEHFADYRTAADRLQASGLLYPCFASRADIEAAAGSERTDPDGARLYPGLWRHADAATVSRRLGTGEPFAMRLNMGRALDTLDHDLIYGAFDPTDLQVGAARVARPDRWGDGVIVRKETPTSYHLSVVVDDALQGVTHVIRGQDLEAATDVHVLLQTLLSLPTPAYHHHPLLRGPTGQKLSKSLGSISLRQLRAEGATPADIRRLVGLT
jgi:glutamyl-Q tRNA(Asp) synthetase